jgi:capsular polysaccharide biosynthesis protein
MSNEKIVSIIRNSIISLQNVLDRIEDSYLNESELVEVKVKIKSEVHAILEMVDKLTSKPQFTLNLKEIQSTTTNTNTTISDLYWLKKTLLFKFYLVYIKPINILRWLAVLVWRLFLLFRRLIVSVDLSFPLVKLKDYVIANQCYVVPVLISDNVKTPSPQVFSNKDEGILVSPHEYYEFPSVYAAELNDAMVHGGSNLVFINGEVIYHDLYNFERDYSSEELHARWTVDVESMRICYPRDIHLTFEVNIGSSFLDALAFNYAHWVTEVLPRIAVFCEMKEYADVPIIVDQHLHSNIMESLALVVGPHRQVITVPYGSVVKVNKLIQVSVTGYVPFERRNNKLVGHSHGIFSSMAFTSLIKKLKTFVVKKENNPYPSKIYLRRKSASRNIINIEKIEKILNQNGYVTIECDELSFIEQISLFSNVDNVIGVTGASFANIIFMKPESEITIFIGEFKYTSYWYWQNIASCTGNSISYFFGEIKDIKNNIHSNFTIDELALRNYIGGKDEA